MITYININSIRKIAKTDKALKPAHPYIIHYVGGGYDFTDDDMEALLHDAQEHHRWLEVDIC